MVDLIRHRHLVDLRDHLALGEAGKMPKARLAGVRSPRQKR